MDLLCFCFIGFALTNAIVFLHAGHWFRKLVSGVSDNEFYDSLDKPMTLITKFRRKSLGRLVRCHTCLGFWAGIFLSYAIGGLTGVYLGVEKLFLVNLCDGLFLSTFNFSFWLIHRKLGSESL